MNTLLWPHIINSFIFPMLAAALRAGTSIRCHSLVQLCVIVCASNIPPLSGTRRRYAPTLSADPIELPRRVDCLAPHMGSSSIHIPLFFSSSLWILTCFPSRMHRRLWGLTVARMALTSVPLWRFNVPNFIGTTTVSPVMNAERLKWL